MLLRWSRIRIPRRRPLASSPAAAACGGPLSGNLLLPLPPPATLHQLRRRFSPAAGARDRDDVSAPYLSVCIRCRKCDADTFAEALLCFGASSVITDENSDLDDFDEIRMTSIFADGEDVAACISTAANSVCLDYAPCYDISPGKPCDWVSSVQEAFETTEVATGLYVVPKWRLPPDPQALNIIINPGLAFGTGEHPTTKLCLLLLQKIIRGGERFMDYGTGSGVLGIAALKMGAVASTGIDIDPQAVTASCENISLNGFGPDRMSVYLVPIQKSSANLKSNEEGDMNRELELSRGKYDIVVANLLLNPLVDLVEDITSYARPNAVIGVSGILSEQVQEIRQVYADYLQNIVVSEMDGWACLHGTKR